MVKSVKTCSRSLEKSKQTPIFQSCRAPGSDTRPSTGSARTVKFVSLSDPTGFRTQTVPDASARAREHERRVGGGRADRTATGPLAPADRRGLNRRGYNRCE